MIVDLSRRERCILWVCMALTLLYVGKMTVWRFLQSKTEERQNQTAKEADALRGYLKRLEENKNVESEYQMYIREFRRERSDEEEMSFLLSIIHATAQECGLNISDLNPSRIRNGEFHNEFAVNLSLNGELFQLMRFVHVLQQHPHFFNVRNLRIEKDVRSQASLRCRMALSRVRLTQTVE